MSKSSEAVIKWRALTKKRIVNAMGGKCVCCSYERCENALELHHLDPSQKEFSFSAVRASPISWERICVELRKCVMLCAICHREHHAGLREIPEDAARFDESFADYKSVERSMRLKSCPICTEPMRSGAVTCSPRCAGQHRSRGAWEGLDLSEMKKTMTYGEIAKVAGVSDVAVHKRMKALGLK